MEFLFESCVLTFCQTNGNCKFMSIMICYFNYGFVLSTQLIENHDFVLRICCCLSDILVTKYMGVV